MGQSPVNLEPVGHPADIPAPRHNEDCGGSGGSRIQTRLARYMRMERGHQ